MTVVGSSAAACNMSARSHSPPWQNQLLSQMHSVRPLQYIREERSRNDSGVLHKKWEKSPRGFHLQRNSAKVFFSSTWKNETWPFGHSASYSARISTVIETTDINRRANCDWRENFNFYARRFAGLKRFVGNESLDEVPVRSVQLTRHSFGRR